MRESIERFRSGSALSVPADIRQPSSPRVPRVPFCAEGKKTRLPRNPVKEKRKSATLLFQLLLSVTAYRTRSRIPLAQQREDKGRGLVSKRKRVHNESCRYCEFHCGKIVQFFERRFVLERVLNRRIKSFDYCHLKRIHATFSQLM